MFENRRRVKGKVLKKILAMIATSLGIGVLLFIFASNYIVRDIEQKPQSGAVEDKVIPQQISLNQTQLPDDITQGNIPQSNIAQGETIQNVAKSTVSGVVGISVLRVDKSSIFDRSTENWGVGSGVIVSDDGYILTNHHVAGGKNKRIIVSLDDGRNVDGTTVWSDSILDLALNIPTT
jgi:serine protease Do